MNSSILIQPLKTGQKKKKPSPFDTLDNRNNTTAIHFSNRKYHVGWVFRHQEIKKTKTSFIAIDLVKKCCPHFSRKLSSLSRSPYPSLMFCSLQKDGVFCSFVIDFFDIRQPVVIVVVAPVALWQMPVRESRMKDVSFLSQKSFRASPGYTCRPDIVDFKLWFLEEKILRGAYTSLERGAEDVHTGAIFVAIALFYRGGGYMPLKSSMIMTVYQFLTARPDKR